MSEETERIIVRIIGVLLFVPFIGLIAFNREFRAYYLNVFFDIGPYCG